MKQMNSPSEDHNNRNRLTTQLGQNKSLPNNIHFLIASLDSSNRQLLSIGQKIKNTSIMKVKANYDVAISSIENSLRSTLSELIESIKQFFTDLDSKLRNIGVVVKSEISRTPQLQHPLHRQRQRQDDKYEVLAERIKSLEVSLRETQQNEKKLVSIIENLIEKYDVRDEPTEIRESPHIRSQLFRNRNLTLSANHMNHMNNMNHIETKTNLNSSHKNLNIMAKRSLYQQLGNMEQSIVQQTSSGGSNKFRLRQIEEDPSEHIYIKKLYSKNPHDKKSLKLNEKSGLFCQPRTKMQQNEESRDATVVSVSEKDKQHRLNFMIDKLNI